MKTLGYVFLSVNLSTKKKKKKKKQRKINRKYIQPMLGWGKIKVSHEFLP